MINNNSLTAWQRWLHHPQKSLLRKALFQIHLWSGLGLGLYIFFISVTGSILVYRNELYVAATPEPIISTLSGQVLSDDELTEKVLLSYPDYKVTRIYRAQNPDQAIELWLEQENKTLKRLFDSRNANDLGSANKTGVILVTKLIEIHEDFLLGDTGRKINGIAAIAVILVLVTGLVIWWPGSNRWQRSLLVHRRVGWKRFIWELHNMVGFWSFAFVMIFALSGIYLCFPQSIHAFADKIQPMTEDNAGSRFVDKLLYWTAFSHFGRINGIGLSCSGPGLCDQSVKAVWALFGLAPALMFVTGSTMWWNRVLRRYLKGKFRHPKGT